MSNSRWPRLGCRIARGSHRSLPPERSRWALLLVVAAIASGCASTGGVVGFHSTPLDPASRATCAPATTARPHFDRVLIIVLENQDYKNAIADPFLGRLATQGAHFTNFRGLFHPSYSNYLAMVAGKEVPTHFDAQVDLNDRTVGDLLIDKGLTWKNYAEGYPRELDQYPNRCFTGHSIGRYARKHVPFASFRRVQTTVQCRNIVNADQFSEDLANNTLPHYAFYSPDLDHDGHDPTTDPKKGLMNASDWLKSFLERYLPRLAATLVVVTYDESGTDTEVPENHVYTVFLGDMVKPDLYGEPYTHYNVLRTIEENFGLGSLADGDSCAKPIEGIWK